MKSEGREEKGQKRYKWNVWQKYSRSGYINLNKIYNEIEYEYVKFIFNFSINMLNEI